MAIANGGNDMGKNEVLKILETAKDENGEVPMRLVRQAFEKLPEPCEDTISRQDAIDAVSNGCQEFRGVFSRCEENILALPSARPEIIRCKDCKYQDENWRRVSVKWLPCMDVRTFSNWYCGSAERGEQNE